MLYDLNEKENRIKLAQVLRYQFESKTLAV